MKNQFENRKFISELTVRGFIVASKSKANYPSTYLSLPSSLNMQYLNEFLSTRKEKNSAIAFLSDMIQDNAVVRYLKDHGYKYIHLSSGKWAPTSSNMHADQLIQINNNLALGIVYSRRYASACLFQIINTIVNFDKNIL